MILETITVGALQVNCYVLGWPETHEAVVIDPGDNAPAILQALQRHELKLTRILATHGHFDHLLAARPLQEATGAKFYMHPGDLPLLEALRQTAHAWLGIDPGPPPEVTGDLQDGQVLRFDETEITVRATPGHSPGGVSLLHQAGKRVFTGDALFAGSIGRTDLPGGDTDTLIQSIRTQLLALPDEYVVLAGHGPATTIGQERRSNPFLDPAAFDFWR
jgi:hydroxyacylglutathione hydrolase